MAANTDIYMSKDYGGNFIRFKVFVIMTSTTHFRSFYSITQGTNESWSQWIETVDPATNVAYTPRAITSGWQGIITEDIGSGLEATISAYWDMAVTNYAAGDIWQSVYSLDEFDAYMIAPIHHERTTDLIYTDADTGIIKFFNLDTEPNENGQYTEVSIDQAGITLEGAGTEGVAKSKPTDMDVYDKNVFVGYGPESEPMIVSYKRDVAGKGSYSMAPLEIRAPKTANSPEESIDKVIEVPGLKMLLPDNTNFEHYNIGISVSHKKLYAISKSSSDIIISDDLGFPISSIALAYEYDWETGEVNVNATPSIYISGYEVLRVAKAELTIVSGELTINMLQDITFDFKNPLVSFPEGSTIGDIATYRNNTSMDGNWASVTPCFREDVTMVVSAYKNTGFGEGEAQIFTGSIGEMEENYQTGVSIFHTLQLSNRSIPNNICSKTSPGHFKSYHWWGEVKSNSRHAIYHDKDRIKFKDPKDWDGAFYNYLTIITKIKTDEGSYTEQTTEYQESAYTSTGDWWASAFAGLLEVLIDVVAFAWLIAGTFGAGPLGPLATSFFRSFVLPTIGKVFLASLFTFGGSAGISAMGTFINSYIQAQIAPGGTDKYYALGFDTGWSSGVSIYLPRLGIGIIDNYKINETFDPIIGVVAHSDNAWVKFGGIAQWQDDYSGVVDLPAIGSKAAGSTEAVDSFLYTFNDRDWSEDFVQGSGAMQGTYTLPHLTQYVHPSATWSGAAWSGAYNSYWSALWSLSKLSPQYETLNGTAYMSLTKAMLPIPIDVSNEEIVQWAPVQCEMTNLADTVSQQIQTAGTNIATITDPVLIHEASVDTANPLHIALITEDENGRGSEFYVLKLEHDGNVTNIRSKSITYFTKLGTTGTGFKSVDNMSSDFGGASTRVITRPILFPISLESDGTTAIADGSLGCLSSEALGYHEYDASATTPAWDGVWGQSMYTDIENGTEVVGGYFKDGEEYKYKIAYLYEGSYISPMGKGAWTHEVTILGSDPLDSADSLKVNLVISKPDPRVTHVLVYRKDPTSQYYAEALSIKLGRFMPVDTSGLQIRCSVLDDGDVLGTFSGDTGLSEIARRPIVYFEQSAVLGGRLYAVNLASPGNPHEDMSHLICSSKPNNFHIFDWANEIAVLPNIPTAIAAFNGRIYVWDDVNTYRINPDTLFIEDTYEGVGCFGRNAFVVTEYGMCFADHNNIYLHDGSKPTSIGAPILTSLETSEFKGWQEITKDMIHVAYDATINSYVIFYRELTGVVPAEDAIESTVTTYAWNTPYTDVFANTVYTATGSPADDTVQLSKIHDVVTDVTMITFYNAGGTALTPTINSVTSGGLVSVAHGTLVTYASVSYKYVQTSSEQPDGGTYYSYDEVTSHIPNVNQYDNKAFIYNRLSGSWTFSDSEYISTVTQGPLGEIYMATPEAIKSFNKGSSKRLWTWDSKEIDFDVANVNKKFSKIYIRGKGLVTEGDNFRVLVDGVSVGFDIKVQDNVIELYKFSVKKGMTIQVRLVDQTGSLEAISFSGKPRRVK